MFSRINAASNPNQPGPYPTGAFPPASTWVPPGAQQQAWQQPLQNTQQPWANPYGPQNDPSWQNASYGFQANPWQTQPWMPPWAPWQQAGQTGAPDPATAMGGAGGFAPPPPPPAAPPQAPAPAPAPTAYTPAGTSGGIPGFNPAVPGGGMHGQQLAPAPVPEAPPSDLYRGHLNVMYGDPYHAERSKRTAWSSAKARAAGGLD